MNKAKLGILFTVVRLILDFTVPSLLIIDTALVLIGLALIVLSYSSSNRNRH